MTLLTFRDPSPPLAALGWRLAGWRLSLKLMRLKLALKDGYDPSQPRVPAGQADGGRWAGGVSGSFRVAQATPRGGGSGRGRSGGGRFSDATPSQLTRLDVSQAQASAAIARVRRTDPNWNPQPGLYETVEGEIANNQAITREANSRFVESEFARARVGRNAVEAAPGPGPFNRPTEAQRREVQRIGDIYGCHQCGARRPGTASGRWVFDHQDPSAVGGPNAGRHGYPQCVNCMYDQSNAVRNILRYRAHDE